MRSVYRRLAVPVFLKVRMASNAIPKKKEAESGEADPQQDVQQAVANTELGRKKKPGAFPDAPVFARIATVLAGPVFNFILAF